MMVFSVLNSIMNIAPGHFPTDIIKIRRNGERFWVKVTHWPSNGDDKRLRGLVLNNLIDPRNRKYKWGSPITFTWDDVLVVNDDEGNSRFVQNSNQVHIVYQ
jgi:hypothetical protein